MKSLLFIVLSLPWQVAAADPTTKDPAQAAVAVPMLGYAYDSAAQRIHPLQGIPGAALAATPLSLPQHSVVAISNELDYALWAGAENPATVLDLRSGANMAVQGALTGASQIAISSGGTAAAVYHASADVIEIITGLPDAPVVARTARTSGLPAHVALLSLGDDGQSLALTLEDGEALLAAGDSFLPLPVPGSAAAVAFNLNGGSIGVATRDGQIWSVTQENGQPKYAVIGSEAGRTPAAIQFSRDGSHVFAAFTDGTIAAFDLAGNPPAETSCGCSPRSFQRGKGNSLFLLQDASATLPQLFDGSGITPRLFFIPKSAEDNEQ